jgi:RNA polymerase subunit RPABC4/transcription elongation factor Spt4
MNTLNLPGTTNKNSLLCEKQNCIEMPITFKQLKKDRDLFKRLPYQTDLDEQKVEEMVRAYQKNPDYLVYKNKIVIAVVPIGLTDDYNLYVIDGQHRIEMAIELVDNHDVNDYLMLCYYKIESDKKMKGLFKEINKDSFKNNKYVSLEEFQETLYDLTLQWIRSDYSIYFPDKKSQQNRTYSSAEFLNLLAAKNYFDQWGTLDDIKKDIESANKSFNKLIDYQEYFIQQPELFYKGEQTCVKNGIIMSLKNNNFIDYLMDKTNTIPDHKFKNQKKTISPKLRIQVWAKEFDNRESGQCPFFRCKNIIHNGLNGFHCGHIVSEFNGGETLLENLRPICASCNCRMSTTNWRDYEIICKRELKKITLQNTKSKIIEI